MKETTCKYGCGQSYIPTGYGRRSPKGHKKCYDAKRRIETASKVEAIQRVNDILEPAGGFAESVKSAAPKHAHPKGWEPHVEERGDAATAISQPMETANPDEEELIRGWNLDPKQWRIVGPVNCRRWQANMPEIVEGKVVGYVQKWLYYYKANLERIDPVREARVTELIEEIRTHKPRRSSTTTSTDDRAFAVCIADWQLGKNDGDGTNGIVARALRAIDASAERQKDLRKIGRGSSSLYVFGLGDLIENCGGYYEQQAFRVELNLREQINVARRLIVKSLEYWSPMFDRVVVAAVGGNHGENRSDGKSFTDFADNHDVGIFEQVSDVVSMNESAYGHVSFVIPNHDLTLTLDVCGTVTALAHGHQFKRGATQAQKAIEWWKGQAMGSTPVGEASLLLSGHYHQLVVQRMNTKTHIQCPSIEGGSEWYANTTGYMGMQPPGVLTLTIGSVDPSGWGNLEIV